MPAFSSDEVSQAPRASSKDMRYEKYKLHLKTGKHSFHFGAFCIFRLEMFKCQVCIKSPSSPFLKPQTANKQQQKTQQSVTIKHSNPKYPRSQAFWLKRYFNHICLSSLPSWKTESGCVAKWHIQANILEEGQVYLVPKRMDGQPMSTEYRSQRTRYAGNDKVNQTENDSSVVFVVFSG